MNNPLVSVIILSYNNFSYIYEALKSLLEQDYSNIELIISDDGSKDFSKSEIEDFLLENKKTNIKNIKFLINEKNLGTVKCINNAIKKSQGEFIIFFAADDAFYDQKSISKFIDAFKKLPKDEFIVTAQLGMYDINLQKLIKLFVSKQHIELLRKNSPKELFSEMADKCITAAASTCYRKRLFEKVGYFDERYKLIEDWSSALRFSRLGIKYHYADFIAFKHRDGGVSHGNINGEKKLNKKYDLDLINIMKYEVLPYLSLLSEVQKKAFMTFYKSHEWRFKYNYVFKNASREERRAFIKNNLGLILKSNYMDLKRYFVDQLDGKKFKLFVLSLLLIMAPFSPVEVIHFGWFMINILIIITAYQLYRIFVLRAYDILKFLI